MGVRQVTPLLPTDIEIEKKSYVEYLLLAPMFFYKGSNNMHHVHAQYIKLLKTPQHQNDG